MRKYNHERHFNYMVECDWCMKSIIKMPCICVAVKNTIDDVGDWAYFHPSCYKKQLKKDKLTGNLLKD